MQFKLCMWFSVIDVIFYIPTALMIYIEEDDDIDNLWTTASTFIVLFLLSLFYSATVTLFKVWFIDVSDMVTW